MKLIVDLLNRADMLASAQLLETMLDAPSATPLQPQGALSIAVATHPLIAPVAPPVSLPPMPAAVPPAALVPLPVAPMPPQAAAPTPPATGVELDSDGLPWDSRIHASTKTKISSGAWKAKKGINDPGMVKRVEAELRGAATRTHGSPELDQDAAKLNAMAGPGAAGPTFAVAPPPPVPDAATIFGGAAPVPGGVGAPIAPPPPMAPAVDPNADPATFETFMMRITKNVQTGHLPMEAVHAAITAHGLAGVAGLQQAPAMVASVWVYLKTQHPSIQ